MTQFLISVASYVEITTTLNKVCVEIDIQISSAAMSDELDLSDSGFLGWRPIVTKILRVGLLYMC